MNRILLRSDPRAIFLMIGSSRLRGDPGDVLRRDGGVVDHHAGGLGAGPPGGGADVVDRSGGEPGESGDVVEEGEQAAAHARSSEVGLTSPSLMRRVGTSTNAATAKVAG